MPYDLSIAHMELGYGVCHAICICTDEGTHMGCSTRHNICMHGITYMMSDVAC